MYTIYAWILSGFIWAAIALLTVAVTIPIAFCATVLRPFDPLRRLGHGIGIWWGGMIVRLNPFWRLRVTGRHHIRTDGAYVLVCNHQSLADIVILYNIRRQFKWLAKDSLFTIPFLGWSMRLNGYIPLERGHRGSIAHSFRQALAWLGQGMSVLVFPEGTRSHTGRVAAFKDGAFRLAIQAQVPVVPIALSGTRDAIPRGSWRFVHQVNAVLTILPPIDTAGYTSDRADALSQQVRQAISAALERQSA